MENKNVQIGLINVVIGGALLWLVLMQRSLVSASDIFFYLATATFLVHWYWGLVAYIQHVGPTQNLWEFMLDIVAVGSQVSTIFWINLPPVWLCLNGLSFLLAIVKYSLSLKNRSLPAKVSAYVREKRRLHSVGLAGMALALILVNYLRPIWLLGLLTLLSHLAAMAYLSHKKVYQLGEDN